jgi:hypothetical protein
MRRVRGPHLLDRRDHLFDIQAGEGFTTHRRGRDTDDVHRTSKFRLWTIRDAILPLLDSLSQTVTDRR